MNRRRVSSVVLTSALSLGLAAAAPPRKAAPELTPDRVHFDLQGLAKTAHGETRPGVPWQEDAEPGVTTEPPSVRFDLGDEGSGNASFRQLIVYSAPAFRELFVKAGLEKGNPIDTLASLVKSGATAVNGEIPILPRIEAMQILKARTQPLSFHGGKGIAFLTAYAQEPIPVGNDSLAYTFQGLTDDGRYWVALYYPVSASVLPKTVMDSPELKDRTAFENHFGAYIQKTARALEDPKTVFTPDLAKLDALVQSIEIR
ncbi:MAG TPA: hypothetical protein VFR03_19125 [Thermoanaerobaculia bacterium]|nr:hypothetical protein [Thermoanaerobaculia bacterium]